MPDPLSLMGTVRKAVVPLFTALTLATCGIMQLNSRQRYLPFMTCDTPQHSPL